MILTKAVLFFGNHVVLACDGRCEKAWGISQRPRLEFSDDPDDVAYLADDEVGIAPVDPGTYEGGHAKPADYSDPARQNKWCARECERSELIEVGEVRLSDFSRRLYNQPWKHPEAKEGGGR